jgi:hypothetical protein
MNDLLSVLANPNRKSLASTSNVHIEEPERINVGNNLSQVRRALKSSQVQRAWKSKFLPLPPESPEEGYNKIVEKSVEDAEFKSLSLAERETRYGKSLKYRESPTGFKPHKSDTYEHEVTPLTSDEWWEITEGRGATRNPRLRKKEDVEKIYGNKVDHDENSRPINNGKQKAKDKISTDHRKTDRVGRPRKEQQQ